MSKVVDLNKFKQIFSPKFAKIDFIELGEHLYQVNVVTRVKGNRVVLYSEVGDHPINLPLNAIEYMEEHHPNIEVIDDKKFDKITMEEYYVT